MSTRRLFLKDVIKASALGAFCTLAPSKDALAYLAKIANEFVPHEFDAWEDEFQAIYKSQKNELDCTIQQKVKQKTTTHRSKYKIGEGKHGTTDPSIIKHFSGRSYKKSVNFSPNAKDAAYDYFSEIPEFMSTPYSNISLEKAKHNVILGNQCFRIANSYNSQGQLLMFNKTDFSISKNTREEFLMVHPAFNSLIANEKYFCYGAPVEKPTVKRCSVCRQFYVTQTFCYKPNSPIYGIEPVYWELISDPYCIKDDNSKTKYHDNITNVEDLITCKCYDKIQPKTFNSGNLD